jgi:hypothetical protein
VWQLPIAPGLQGKAKPSSRRKPGPSGCSKNLDSGLRRNDDAGLFLFPDKASFLIADNQSADPMKSIGATLVIRYKRLKVANGYSKAERQSNHWNALNSGCLLHSGKLKFEA